MGGYAPSETSFELQLGQAYHAGVAEIGRQQMEQQSVEKSLDNGGKLG